MFSGEDPQVDINTAKGVEKASLFIKIDARDEHVHSSVKEYFLTWRGVFNSSLEVYPETWSRLLSDFPFAPKALGKESLPVFMWQNQPSIVQYSSSGLALANHRCIISDGSLSTEFKRYNAYYNFEIRVASPIAHASIDRWYRGEDIGEDKYMRARFHFDEWFVKTSDIRRSAMGDAICADWDRWSRYKNSMVVPSIEPPNGRQGREKLYWREVLCICFPAFAWLMGENCTGGEVLEAWNLLPIVRRVKANGSKRGPGR